jgi:GTP pyrophosphokinase
VNINAAGTHFKGLVTVFVKNTEHLHRIFDRLRKIKGISSIERFEG